MKNEECTSKMYTLIEGVNKKINVLFPFPITEFQKLYNTGMSMRYISSGIPLILGFKVIYLTMYCIF